MLNFVNSILILQGKILIKVSKLEKRWLYVILETYRGLSFILKKISMPPLKPSSQRRSRVRTEFLSPHRLPFLLVFRVRIDFSLFFSIESKLFQISMGRERETQQQQQTSYTVEELVAVNPYNPDILPDLENYVHEQVSFINLLSFNDDNPMALSHIWARLGAPQISIIVVSPIIYVISLFWMALLFGNHGKCGCAFSTAQQSVESIEHKSV